MQSIPVQSWTFEPQSVIRLGRSNDNDVILYSAVVSRHHVEVRPNGSGWEIVSLGANGTYVDGERITQVPVVDGMIMRLASSGPKIQIRLGAVAGAESTPKIKTAGEKKPATESKDEVTTKTFLQGRSTDMDDKTEADMNIPSSFLPE